MNFADQYETPGLEQQKKLLEHIVKSIVNKPELVRIKLETKDTGKPFFTLQVGEKDLGKVIGKNGKTIKSIRSLINVININSQGVSVDVSA